MGSKKKKSRWALTFTLSAGLGSGSVFAIQKSLDMLVAFKLAKPIVAYAVPEILLISAIPAFLIGLPFMPRLYAKQTEKMIKNHTPYTMTDSLTGDLVTLSHLKKSFLCTYTGVFTGVMLACAAGIAGQAYSGPPSWWYDDARRSGNVITDRTKIASYRPSLTYEKQKPVMTFKF